MQDETTRARELRRDGSRAEKICWEFLRDRRMGGVKFQRQHPIGPYVADYVVRNPDDVWAEIEQVVSVPLTQPLPQGGEETDMK